MKPFDHPHGTIVGVDLHRLVQHGAIKGVETSQVGNCAIDVKLGSWVKMEKKPLTLDTEEQEIVLVTDQHSDHLVKAEPMKVEHGARVWRIPPKTFALTITSETFCLPPNVSATFSLRSVCARNGLDQVMSVNMWAGFKGALVLELYNLLTYTPLYLKEFDCIGQVEFKCHRETVPYDGKYQNQ
ncbi:deoxycytidine triphosphate deaminase [Vibrio phage VH2_2019]|nr:deoxycytidine triphosphate deaminase [Vibrio phage VH2_2019]